MPQLGWLTRSHAEVPDGDDWLGPRERAVQSAFVRAKRREDWRLGRWTAKAALAATCGAAVERLEVVAAADGAPEPFLDGRPLALSLSLSHRAGLGIAAVGGGAVGCDVELVEPRSRAFAEDWLAEPERDWAGEDPLRLNLVWTAKEAAAKVRRAGLRLDVRAAVTSVEWGDGPWHPLRVGWPDATTHGWWRAQDGYVFTVAAAPAAGPPEPL